MLRNSGRFALVGVTSSVIVELSMLFAYCDSEIDKSSGDRNSIAMQHSLETKEFMFDQKPYEVVQNHVN
jgi:hypothetical protein